MSIQTYDMLRSMVESAVFHQPVTAERLRQLIVELANTVAPSLSESQMEDIARDIEYKDGISVGLGAIVDSDEFEPWLDDSKADIDPFYWGRYKKLLLNTGLPKDVVITTDEMTDKILSRLGNPKKDVPWDRRGMVVGHVQSGKTANYTGLICKAADAGYRLIIVIAGIHNNLRNQTQERIDEGFIGRDTGKTQEVKKNGKPHKIGVGHFGLINTPVSLTNTIKDFNKETASTNTSEIDSYKVPVVLVIKKNHRTLENLISWLRDNSARGDKAMIDQPMLLIDDEADNASINTKYKKGLITKINGQIRDLLGIFNRSCYVGYTATPFANIFIDPEQESEMVKEDLFPEDFIIGLDAPSNYFGPSKVFIDGLPDEGEPEWLRYINDNEDVFPIKHTIDQHLETLPTSLTRAVRAFLLARTIRNIRGGASAHCSMLVNASRFTRVQGLLKNRIHEVLEDIKNSVRVNAARGPTALGDPEIAKLHQVWVEEYQEAEPSWQIIQDNLHDAIAAAKVVEVNSKANDLNYPRGNDLGQTVIAVGGFSLSRGLTLEGLTITWFLRNTLMYDTLMQMGRWFGYRDGYEDLCRIWMPETAIDWYAFIANASEELHGELKLMEKAKATPKMFGLAVRSHPASLLVTARNKMGSSQTVTTSIGLSNAFVETTRISLDDDDINTNRETAKALVEELRDSELDPEDTPGGRLWKKVDVEKIDRFLARWRNAAESGIANTGPVRKYIKARSADELCFWDVLVVSKKIGVQSDLLGVPIVPVKRKVAFLGDNDVDLAFSGKGLRLASRGIEKAGLSGEQAKNAEEKFREEKKIKMSQKINYPDKAYRLFRQRPLLIIHLIETELASVPPERQSSELKKPVVGWGISLPKSSRPAEKVEYVVNTKKYAELFGEEDEDEDEEIEHVGK